MLRNALCRRFVAISNCVREDIVANGAAKNKVRVVYNAIDLTRFEPRPRKADGTIRIAQVARIMPEKKGQDLLLAAMEKLHGRYPQLHCYFAGAADDAHQQALEQLKDQTEKCNLSECVTFLGNVEDVPGLLATIDLFVLPSRYEGFGISLIEAMAMGIPCVASHLDGPAEVLRSGKYGTLFTPDDCDDLVEKLTDAIKYLPEKQEIARKAQIYVNETYSIVTMCDQLEQVMKE